MDYTLDVLYVTKKYEPLDSTGALGGNAPPPYRTPVPSNSWGKVMKRSLTSTPAALRDVCGDTAPSSAGAAVLASADVGAIQRLQTATSSNSAASFGEKAADKIAKRNPSRQVEGNSIKGILSSPPLQPRGPAVEVDSIHAPIAAPPHETEYRRASSPVPAVTQPPPLPSALSTAVPVSCGCHGLHPVVPGLCSIINTASLTPRHTATAVTTSGTAGSPSGGNGVLQRRAGYLRRCERSVSTKALAGHYVLLYLSPPHRAGETSNAAPLWNNVSTGAPTTGTVAANLTGTAVGNGVGVAGARLPPATAALQSASIESTKHRLNVGSAAPPSQPAGTSPSTFATAGGRAVFPNPLTKAADATTPTSMSGGGSIHNAGGHIGSPISGLSAASRQALVRMAAAAVTTQQKLLLFYCLLLHRLGNQQKRTSNTSPDGQDYLDASTQGPVPIAVLELEYVTEGPARTVPSAVSGVLSSGQGSGGMPAASNTSLLATDGLAVNLSLAPPSTVGGGGGGGGSSTGARLLPSNNGGLRSRSPRPTSSSLPIQPGGRSGISHAEPLFDSGTPSSMPATTPSPHQFLPFPPTFIGEENGAMPAGDRTYEGGPDAPPSEEGALLASRAGVRPADAQATLRLSAILHHLLQGQPDLLLHSDNIFFDTEMTKNPYYGGWYSVQSNDGYRRVTQMCGIQSWPAVVLLDPSGNVITADALHYLEEDLSRYAKDVDTQLAMFPTGADAAVTTTSPITAAGNATTSAELSSEKSALCLFARSGDAHREPSKPSVLPVPQRYVEEPRSTTLQLAPPSSPPAKAPVAGGGALPHSSRSLPASPGALSASAPLKEGETLTEDLLDTPKRRDSSLSVSPNRREDSMDSHDPQIPTAEPTPMKALPVTARYREKSDSCSATGAQAGAQSTPLQDIGTASEIGSLTTSCNAETGVSGAEAMLALTKRMTGVNALHAAVSGPTSNASLPSKNDHAVERVKRSDELHERSTDLPHPRPPKDCASFRGKSSTLAMSASNLSHPSASVTRTCAKQPIEGSRESSVLLSVPLADTALMPEIHADLDRPIHTGEGQACHNALLKVATPHSSVSPLNGLASQSCVPADSDDEELVLPTLNLTARDVQLQSGGVSGFAVAAGGASPPPLSFIPLPVFASGFPWNHSLTDLLVAFAPASLMSTYTTAAETTELLELLGKRSCIPAGGYGSDDEGESATPVGPPKARTSSLSTSFPADGSQCWKAATAVQGEKKNGGGMGETNRSSGSLPSTQLSTPKAPVTVFEQASQEAASASASAGGSPSAIALGESVAANLYGALRLRSPQAVQQELTAWAEKALLTLADHQPLLMHPVARLAHCAVTAQEVRERAEKARHNAASPSLEHVEIGEPLAKASLRQEVALQKVAGSPQEDLLLASSLLVDSAVDSSVRYSAGSRSALRPPPPVLQPLLTQLDSVASTSVKKQLENWQRLANVKWEYFTHVLLLFGAAWHPGMGRCVRAVRRLCNALNEPMHATMDDGGEEKVFGGEEAGSLPTDFRTPIVQGFDSEFNAADDDTSDFFSLHRFRPVQREASGGGTNGLNGSFENASRMEWRCGGSLLPGGGTTHLSDEGEQVPRASPPGEMTAALEASTSPLASNLCPRRRVQVLYVSADESLEAVRSAMEDLPADWCCVSPYVARNAQECRWQQQACDAVRDVFHVTTFPRLVVVETPSTPLQPPVGAEGKAISGNAAATLSSSKKIISTEEEEGAGEGLGDGVGYLHATQHNLLSPPPMSAPQLERHWTVVQQHGEAYVYGDPDGKDFPWTSRPARDLHVASDVRAVMRRDSQHTCTSLLSDIRQRQQQLDALNAALSSHASLPLEGSNAGGSEYAALSCSQTELRAAPQTGADLRTLNVEKGCGGAVAAATCSATLYSLYPTAPHYIQRIKTFSAAGGDLQLLLERGGYFVVLCAFGSVDARLHLQCLDALDESRRWLYAQVEARRHEAWSETMQPDPTTQYSMYRMPFKTEGDDERLSPAVLSGASANSFPDEHNTLPQSSPGLSISAVPSLTTGPNGGDHGANNTLHRVGLGSSSTRGGCTPLVLDEGWPEPHGGGASLKHSVASPPCHSGSSHHVESAAGQSGHRIGSGAPPSPPMVAHKSSSASPLPTVYFYDSILSPAPTTLHPSHPVSAADQVEGVKVRGDVEGFPARSAVTTRRRSSPAAAFTTPSGATPSLTNQAPVDSSTAAVSGTFCPIPTPPEEKLHNTASLRRRHTADLALLQEYVIAPILEIDEKQLPVREGEVFLACVRWPHRTGGVLRRRRASEARLLTTTGSLISAGTTSVAAGSSSSVAGGATAGASGGGAATPMPVANVGLRGTAVPSFVGQTSLLPEALPRRSSVSATSSPSSNSPTAATSLSHAAANAEDGGTSSHLSASTAAANAPHSATTAAASGTDPVPPANSYSTEGVDSPPLGSSASLQNLCRTEDDTKGGAADPEATPVSSASTIKSFLYEHILRPMDY